MGEMIKLFSKGKLTKILLILYIVLTISLGFLVIHSNNMLRNIFNNFLVLQDFEGFVSELALTIGLFTSVFSMQLLSVFLLQKFVWEGQKRLLNQYIKKTLHNDYSFFVKNEAAEVWSNMNMATQGVSNLLGNFMELMALIVGFVFYGIVVFRINFFVGVLTVIVMPIFFLLTVRISKKFMPLQFELMQDHGRMSVVAQESLANAGNVKSKNAYVFFTKRIMEIQHTISKNQRKVNVSMSYIGGISGLISVITPILILFVAARFFDSPITDAGAILVLFINIPLFLRGFVAMHQQYVIYKSKVPSLNKLKAFDSVPSERKGDVCIDTFDFLETRNVRVCFESTRNIHIPDIKIKKGEKVMLFGESGVGKSTIFNIIMGLNTDYVGDVVVNGINLRQIDPSSLRDIFGIVFQTTNVLSLTIKENILLSKNDIEIDDIIELTNLKSQMDAKADDILANTVMSGGEKSRLGLAQTLVRKPEIILIDEAFSNVDEEMEAMITASLFKKYPDMTVVCISHRNASRVFYDRVIEFK
jgi:ABC-type multidrug transport system fused ATPase/permease subunit